MNYKELADTAEAHNKVLTAVIKTLNESVQSLTDKVEQLQNLLLAKDENTERLTSKLNGLVKIALPKKTERRKTMTSGLDSRTPAPTPKERGNNGAKRKVYHDIEELDPISIYPIESDFVKDIATLISVRNVTRYLYIPPRLVKQIYKCHNYKIGDVVYNAKTPVSPLLNSNFDSSIIANIIQQRFIYGMPVERIVRQYNEMGIDMPKPTAHGLLTKAGDLLDKLNPALKEAVLSDTYLHFDETYHTVIDKESTGGSRKGYFWAALSQRNKLMHFFYADGSRAKKVFTDYLQSTYKVAIQTDGYSTYKTVETWDYPNTIRLGCIQHCKRKFFDIENQKEAKEIIDLYNEFYLLRKRKHKDVWVKESLEIYERLKKRLREIESDKEVLCNAILSKGVAYCINELESIRNIITSTHYDLDNNQIERPMRYISTSRKNSMFCGSQKGANRMALIYSLAISCRLNNINTFSYFCDVINRLALLQHSPTSEQLRELLPDKWAEIK